MTMSSTLISARANEIIRTRPVSALRNSLVLHFRLDLPPFHSLNVTQIAMRRGLSTLYGSVHLRIMVMSVQVRTSRMNAMIAFEKVFTNREV